MSQKEERRRWKDMGWPEWENELRKAWESNRSRFATPWDEVMHHDRVSMFRMLIAEEEATR